MTARDWLRENGYADVADLIDLVMAEIEASGSRQRRNWWDTLAGGQGGRPITVSGHEFPVLRVAQIRQGKPVTPNAICRNENEVPPGVITTNRWPRRKRKRPAKAEARAGKPRPSASAKVG